MTRDYDVKLALNLNNGSRKSLTNDIQLIIKSFGLVNTEVRISVRTLIKDILAINSDNTISDDDWLKVLDLYYLLRDFFNLRKNWIFNNCPNFFDTYMVLAND